MKFKKCLAVLLAVLFVVQTIPMSVIAAETETESVTQESVTEGRENASTDDTEIDIDSIIESSKVEKEEAPEIIGEIEERREESVKHFRRADGSYVAAVYGEPVHYKANGEWKEIDNTLSLSDKKLSATGKETYVNKASSMPVSIPQDFSGGQKISLTSDGYTVGFGVSSKNSGVKLQSEATVKDVEALASSKTMNKENTPESFKELQDAAEETSLPGIGSEKEPVKFEAKDPTAVENTTSAVTYTDVFPGADIEYIVTPTKVKENIVINSKQSVYSYKFDMDFGELVPVKQEDGSIDLVEKDEEGKVVKKAFAIQAPYMYDANGVYNYDVSIGVVPNGEMYTLTVTADESWINDEERAFPVVIDPTLTSALERSAVHDTEVKSNNPHTNYNSDTTLNVGRNLNSLSRLYFKLDIPTLPQDSVVTESTFRVYQYDYMNFLTYDNIYLNLYDLSGCSQWNPSTITWSNQPVSTSSNGCSSMTVHDFDLYERTRGMYYHFNITQLTKYWYDGGINNGFLMAFSDENVTKRSLIYSSENASGSYPNLKIVYSNNTGLESYWTYESVGLGRGTAHINHNNGSLTYVHNDINLSGNRMPLNISHVYTTNKEELASINSIMNFGAGFRLNIVERLTSVPYGTIGSAYHYKLVDGDGTVHYFIETDGVYHYEFDESIVLTSSGSTYTITDSKGNIKRYQYFPGLSMYLLYEIEDANGNIQTFTYTDNKITSVADPAGRTATLAYDTNNYLTSITDPAGRVTSFTYDSGKLTEIEYPDGNTTEFSYSGNDISAITAFDTSDLQLTYTSTGVKRIITAEKRGKLSGSLRETVNSLDFTYETGKTIVTDDFDKTNTFIFDSAGRTVNIWDQDDRIVSTSYYTYDTANKNNKVASATDLITFSDNFLFNHHFERTTLSVYNNWDIGYDEYYDESYELENDIWVENDCMRVENEVADDNWSYSQFVYLDEGETYTLSVDVKIPEPLEVNGEGGAWIGLGYNDENFDWVEDKGAYIAEGSDWTRYTHTFIAPANTYNFLICCGIENAVGIAYFDNAQLEKGSASNLYNYVIDPCFDHFSDAWALESGDSSVDKIVSTNGDDAFVLNGDPQEVKMFSQQIPVNVLPGESITLGVEAEANACGSNSDDSLFGAIVEYYDDIENESVYEYVPFDKDIKGRQTCFKTITFDQYQYTIMLHLVYAYQQNTAKFNKVAVYKGSCGSIYEYDDSGRLTEISNGKDEKTAYTYENSTSTYVTNITTKRKGAFLSSVDYTYDIDHNIIETVTKDGDETNDGIVTEYTYTSYGLPSEITVSSDSGAYSTSVSTTYTNDYNYVASETNERGETTSYTYNTTKGIKLSETDPENNTISYTYDQYTDELLSTSGTGSTTMTTSYGYEDDALSTITRNGMTYSYERDDFGRVVSSSVGTQELVENTYNDNSTLSRVDYANGDYYEADYDSLDRLTGVSYNGVEDFTYTYNDRNQVVKIGDNVNDKTWSYEYDLYNRLIGIISSDTTRSRLNYDNAGNLTGQKITKDGDVLFDAEYTYTADNKPESILLASADNSEIDYEYAGLNRLDNTTHTMKASAPTEQVRKSYEYETVGGNDTQTVSSLTYERVSNGLVTDDYGTLEYTYDDNGNIETITQDQQLIAKYTYDGLNQLVREDNAQSGDSIVYAYDAGGNLLTKEYYDYTTGTLGTMLTDYDFGYDNTVWKDQMTDYNGTDLTYDAVGNMTDYGNNLHFTWDKGNQLASVVFDLYNLTVSYKYDQNGMRAQKLVNGFAYMDFTYIGDKLISQKDYIGNTTLGFIYDAMGEMIGVKYDGETYFYMRNLQGDVCGIYDSDGDLIVKYTYDVWGKRLNVTDANGVYISDLTSIAHVNPIRYRGYYYDSEFEFYYLQSRYYWPAIGRFISADSLFMAGDALVGTNMYAYCSNNPVMYSDPSGHSNEFSLGFAKTFRTLGMIARLFLSGKSLLNIYSYDDLVIRYNASFNDIEWPTGNEQVVDDYPNYPSGGEHHGTDFGGNEGDPIYAAVGGQVITVVNKYAGSMRGSTGDPSFGNYVLIKDANGTLYYYAHMELDSIVVQEGEYVIAGQRIGGMGITGNAYCIHLHYAVRVNGDWVNPADYLPS